MTFCRFPGGLLLGLASINPWGRAGAPPGHCEPSENGPDQGPNRPKASSHWPAAASAAAERLEFPEIASHSAVKILFACRSVNVVSLGMPLMGRGWFDSPHADGPSSLTPVSGVRPIMLWPPRRGVAHSNDAGFPGG
ncbi:uncharacterized protein B0H64DRAFT_79514 [Chaetomium fimeti]|uniref:Secreted protein n=1 Tax=Chaetomium fimeti TaxID=1854472 RepID=A0AAE0HL87_9PEZI|nr:hypothetical protein B0H64DRAFT_79514 [Chaetomium fimeti]